MKIDMANLRVLSRCIQVLFAPLRDLHGHRVRTVKSKSFSRKLNSSLSYFMYHLIIS